MNFRAVAISAAILSSANVARANTVELEVAAKLALDIDRLRLHIEREVISASMVRVRIESLAPSGAHAEVELDHRRLQRDIDLADVKQDERERIIALAIGEPLRGPFPRGANTDVPPETPE